MKHVKLFESFKLQESFLSEAASKKGTGDFETNLIDGLNKLGVESEHSNGDNFPYTLTNKKGNELFIKVVGKKVYGLVQGYKDDIHLDEIDNTPVGIANLMKSLTKKWFKENDPHGDQW